MHATLPLLVHSAFPALRYRVVDTHLVNLGYLYDCDFNQQHWLPIRDAGQGSNSSGGALTGGTTLTPACPA
ncbi:MAG: hypothetical protein CVU30_07565 [Betaproteobacteria bacterium HGW-Betaproteobacteria-3]|jgi:hypothetical protein|nr:MAG: hypothetical protein CVU30_07565 [Betaproteobacteria bacterium HGW-Betaproteobacteria-3]